MGRRASARRAAAALAGACIAIFAVCVWTGVHNDVELPQARWLPKPVLSQLQRALAAKRAPHKPLWPLDARDGFGFALASVSIALAATGGLGGGGCTARGICSAAPLALSLPPPLSRWRCC